jgi:hypothetical protein
MSSKETNKNVIDLRKASAKPVPPPQQAIRFTPAAQAPRLRSTRGARVSPVRVRRRRTRSIILAILLVVIALAVYGVSWVSYLPRYNIGTVTVVGTQEVQSADVESYVESLLHAPGHPFLSRDNIFLYDPKVLESAIVANFPRIATAAVSRASLFATDMTVTVQERQPYALWCSDDAHTDCYEMDDTGFIFTPAPTSAVPAPADASAADETSSPQTAASSTVADQPSSSPSQPLQYIFEGGLGFATSTDATSTVPADASSTSPAALPSVTPADPIGQTFVGAHMPGIVALLGDLSKAGFTPTGATVVDDQDFWVPLTQGFYIKASFGEDPGNIVSNLQLVLSSDALNGMESQLQYVDLRFGDRVYYKLQGADETQT